eukprot:m.113055 g.113055  ORF g.113055 m.113055 type:complete len:68 (-) comp15434_c0_seq1:47-250(-)
MLPSDKLCLLGTNGLLCDVANAGEPQLEQQVPANCAQKFLAPFQNTPCKMMWTVIGDCHFEDNSASE